MDKFQSLPPVNISSSSSKGNEFVILQITDLHHFDLEHKSFAGPRTTVDIGDDEKNLTSQELGDYSTKRGLALVNHLIAMVRPNLVIFSGDIIDGRKCKNHIAAMTQVIQPCIKYQIKWTFCPGNHDDDLPSKYAHEDLLQLYNLPYCASRGATSFNHTFRLMNSHNHNNRNTGPRIFMFDSHGSNKTGKKDGITTTTIESYKNWSSTKEAKHECEIDNVIGLAYFHIPLHEYAQKSANIIRGRIDPMSSMRALWNIKDDVRLVGIPNKNTGFYNAMLSSGNIRSTFVGHDHYHDAVLCRDDGGPWMCWGRVTSFTPPSDFETAGGALPFRRGGRVVKIKNTKMETYIVNAEGIEEDSRIELVERRSTKL
jgi:hypothetical protein